MGSTKETLLYNLKIVYYYVIEVVDSESDFGFYNKGLISEIFVFLLIRVSFTI